jgi:hypothetical protein
MRKDGDIDKVFDQLHLLKSSCILSSSETADDILRFLKTRFYEKSHGECSGEER